MWLHLVLVFILFLVKCGSTEIRVWILFKPGVNRAFLRHCVNVVLNNGINLPFLSPLLIWTPRGDTEIWTSSCFQISSSDSGNNIELHILVSYRSCSNIRCESGKQTLIRNCNATDCTTVHYIALIKHRNAIHSNAMLRNPIHCTLLNCNAM